ncbi:MAG: hypothetical protein UY41_C0018G0005 [Candidatus Moranbacteria bacterium GW2011_GWE1_49_15]|nr:MAG: hypothetical protein UX75_C0051G0005 [Candidatus Moranbacteria bacterium GW2011_GWE2_47_10]KKW06647.1 MAG: hypothetical protein UY41_C0018G0005 [Candidatus Moranbacteria bacterium GW2011_GWE1_49_15]HBP00699.1 hypothetical protein [Candidatus Moranbacteria bacterium]
MKKYKIRVVRGAFINPVMLDSLGARTIEKLGCSEWQSIDEVVCDMEQIGELKKNMTRHFDDSTVPWYMDGYGVEDVDEVIVVFGADDGEGGKIFEFRRGDQESLSEIVEYGISKGIPKEQMDFMDISF